MPGSTLVEQLAAHLAGLRLADLPPAVVGKARQAVRDALGAMVAGAATGEAAGVRAALAEIDEGRGCTVVGSSLRLSAASAALANGTSAHARELDDFGVCGHPGAVVVPAVLAVAERTGAPGSAVVEAVVAGYEASARVAEGAGGYRAHTDLGWHSTGTFGSFAAAAGVARVLGCDAEVTADALGLAGSFTGGLWAFLADGAASKRVHPGKAASNGLVAAYLARGGVTGPRQVLEAEWGGFFSTYGPADAARPEAVVDGLGEAYAIMEVGFKPYACCRGLHFPIDALSEIMAANGLAAADVAHVVLRCPPRQVMQFGKRDVATTIDAQMSLPYAIAVRLLTGRVGLAEFSDERVRDPAVRALMERVELVEDAAMGSAERPWVRVETAAGEVHERQVVEALGAPGNPMPEQDLRAKFVDLVSSARLRSTPDELAELCARLDDLPDVRELLAGLAAAP